MFYSKSSGGFYTAEVHGENIPSDAVVITKDEHVALMIGQASGKTISSDGEGKPVLIDPTDPTDEEIAAAVDAARLAAYQKHADPTYFKYQRGEATEDEWLAVIAAIKAHYPDGVMPTSGVFAYSV